VIRLAVPTDVRIYNAPTLAQAIAELKREIERQWVRELRAPRQPAKVPAITLPTTRTELALDARRRIRPGRLVGVNGRPWNDFGAARA